MSDYEFTTYWRVEGTCGEVADVLADPLALTRWWPSVYLAAEEIRPPDAQRLGQIVRLHTKGWLPYTLTWDLEVLDRRYPHALTIAARGDFEGTGAWTLNQDGRFVNVLFEWRVRADKPLLRNFSFVFRPLFEANHRWAMREGLTSLKLELARRRATSDLARAAVPPPPGPVTYSGVALVAGAAAIGAVTFVAVKRLARRPTRESFDR